MEREELQEVIMNNQNLIYSIIHKFKGGDIEDLYQAGCLGLIKAWKNFNPDFKTKFTTYAYKYILSEVIMFVNNSKLIKTSREYHKLYKKILEARTILTQKLMKEPSTYEISLFLEIDEQIIYDVMRYQDNVKSLDEVIMDDGKKLTLLDRISLEKSNISDDMISLKEGLENLTTEERELINLRYFEDKTQSEIAKFWGTNQVNVSRNEQKVLKKLKKNLCECR